MISGHGCADWPRTSQPRSRVPSSAVSSKASTARDRLLQRSSGAFVQRLGIRRSTAPARDRPAGRRPAASTVTVTSEGRHVAQRDVGKLRSGRATRVSLGMRYLSRARRALPFSAASLCGKRVMRSSSVLRALGIVAQRGIGTAQVEQRVGDLGAVGIVRDQRLLGSGGRLEIAQVEPGIADPVLRVGGERIARIALDDTVECCDRALDSRPARYAANPAS